MGAAYAPTPNDLAAVDPYRQFVPTETPKGALETMMGICAESWASQGDILAWQPPVVKGALLLCPNAPHAALLQSRGNGEVVRDGSQVVGKEVTPGTGKTAAGVQDCYWERTRDLQRRTLRALLTVGTACAMPDVNDGPKLTPSRRAGSTACRNTPGR